MTAAKRLPECFILLCQDAGPSQDQIRNLKERYKEAGYLLPLPANVVEITYKTTSKKDTHFYAVEVRKEQ